MDLNKAMIIGRLTRDPEIRTTPQGANVCSFSIATNFVYKSQSGEKVEQVEYHNIVAWRKLAEIAGQYLKKGSRVYVEGRIQTRSWDATDGQKKNRTEIVMDNMIMLDSKGGSPSGSMGGNSFESGSNNSFEKSLEQIPTINQDQPMDEEISVEDIPF
ncbi:MAG: single-strand binding protein single-strand DNA-binding protein [Candidatus Doudnabacteria bacterium]|nr:single-strand binding protein single-strand DNA-binding protein [Candidatus Doudnabacteria bacterium]